MEKKTKGFSKQDYDMVKNLKDNRTPEFLCGLIGV